MSDITDQQEEIDHLHAEIERLRAVIASFPCQCLPNGIVCHRCKEARRG